MSDEGYPPAKRSRVAARTLKSEEREWDEWWEEVHDGLGWGDGFGNDEDGEPVDEDFVMFRNDILPDTDTASAETRRVAEQMASVIQTKAVVDLELHLDLELATLLVNALVQSNRSVRHILVHCLPESAHEWREANIHLHGEGGQIITDASGSSMHIDTIPERKLNARTLLIDEIGNQALQDKVTAAGGIVVVVKGE